MDMRIARRDARCSAIAHWSFWCCWTQRVLLEIDPAESKRVRAFQNAIRTSVRVITARVRIVLRLR